MNIENNENHENLNSHRSHRLARIINKNIENPFCRLWLLQSLSVKCYGSAFKNKFLRQFQISYHITIVITNLRRKNPAFSRKTDFNPSFDIIFFEHGLHELTRIYDSWQLIIDNWKLFIQWTSKITKTTKTLSVRLRLMSLMLCLHAFACKYTSSASLHSLHLIPTGW